MERPVSNLPIAFEWQKGPWLEIFDENVRFIQQDILRALASDRMVVYLSCPLSSRGGSVALTNVEIAEATARHLTSEWGPRFWFLNPGYYQLESKHGQGLIKRHAEVLRLRGVALNIDELLKKENRPGGGDYMRMWTRVLAEDGGQNLGDYFSAYYFLGPSDVAAFFRAAGGHQSLSNCVEEYFARKYVTDPDFAAFFTKPYRDDAGQELPESIQSTEGERRRKEFLRYYTVRASAAFSRGSHDEWNILVALNELRLKNPALGIGQQIPGFYDGYQVDPASVATAIRPGYAVEEKPSPLQLFPAPGPPTATTSRSKAVEALIKHGAAGVKADKRAG